MGSIGKNKRGSGVLLHITSLPSHYGIGDLGPQAYRFVNFLVESKQKYWQVLPLNLTDTSYGNSPYSSVSAFAGNNLLISPEFMVRDGFLVETEVEYFTDTEYQNVDYVKVTEFKNRIFCLAYNRFKSSDNRVGYDRFCKENAFWLDSFALFVVIKAHVNNDVWSSWPEGLRHRRPDDLQEVKDSLSDKVEKEKFLQYLFYCQWMELKNFCNEKGISIIGDIPIYVIYDSVDVWQHPDLFKLYENDQMEVVAGVPPDYFSETGQLWGNPVYRWESLQKSGYKWWIERFKYNLELFDYTRVDHFRGFAAYWEVGADETTAINGKWVEAPGREFFDTVLKQIPSANIIAEDLGVITDDVKELINYFGFPGMKILLFAFGDNIATNPYVPHNHVENCIVYTGTHDNNTVRGWFESEVDEETKIKLFDYIGHSVEVEDIHWVFIRLAMMSVADRVIFPAQDILGLDSSSRMNIPATSNCNWEWRLYPDQLTTQLAERLGRMVGMYGRT